MLLQANRILTPKSLSCLQNLLLMVYIYERGEIVRP